MAHYDGVAVDLAALRTALVSACTTEGWGWDGSAEVLSKGTMFVRVQVVSGYLTLLARTSASSGDAPHVVRMGQVGTTPLTWPLSYEIFVFDNEVFMVINYSIDYYQFCAFGLSTIPGMPGTGMWIGATLSHTAATSVDGVSISPTAGGANTSSRTAPALFWSTSLSSSQAAHRNYFIHSDLDGQGWWPAQSLTDAPVGIAAAAPLISILPNSWNSEAVLVPIRAYKVRPSSKVSLTVEVQNARYTRNDNYEPGQIITIGPDRWKIFPWYRKNASERNAGLVGHSGTLAWAIRYEGD